MPTAQHISSEIFGIQEKGPDLLVVIIFAKLEFGFQRTSDKPKYDAYCIHAYCLQIIIITNEIVLVHRERNAQVLKFLNSNLNRGLHDEEPVCAMGAVKS